MKRLWKDLFLILSFLILFPTFVLAERVYTVAIVPQFPLLELKERWEPFLELLSKETGLKFALKFYESIPHFEKDILAGNPDLAFMSPYHQVMVKKHYIPLIKDKTPLEGILVVRKDSPINSVKELDGKTIAFPAPNAYAAALYMRALLREKEKITFTPIYVKTHNNVYRWVVLGKAEAGGGVNNTLQREREEIKAQLRILYITPGSAPHPFSANKKIPKEIQNLIKEAFLKIAKDPKNRILLNGIQIPEPLVADYKKDYLPLERLGLEKYLVLEE